jgi:plastocyanin
VLRSPRVLLAVLALSACSSGSSGSAAPPKAGGSALTIAGFAYAPAPLTVAPGASVPVTNTDSALHTVTSDVTGLFVADDVAHGTTVTFTAPAKPGRYTFHCEYHPSMHGTLVVTG